MNTIAGALRSVIKPARIMLWPIVFVVGGAVAMAQTTPAPAPAPAPAAPKKAPRKAEKKEPAPPAQAQPAPAPQTAPQQPMQPAAAPAPMPPVIYSPWTKICPKPPPNAPQTPGICLTVKEARLETGQFVAGAALIEQAGEDKKLLRITLPLGMQLAPGTRVTLDAEQPLAGPYVVCVPNGCMADYQITGEFVGKLKKGQQLLLQGVNMPGQVAGFTLPLGDFAKASDGPPTDPEIFEAKQKAEWEKRLKENPPANAPVAPAPK
jgi:invasion protein IalB